MNKQNRRALDDVKTDINTALSQSKAKSGENWKLIWIVYNHSHTGSM